MSSQSSDPVRSSRRRFMAKGAGALTSAALLPEGWAKALDQVAVSPSPALTPGAKTVWGIAELWEWLWAKQASTGHDSADCLQAHLDHGIRHVMWALGRSTLDYHSALPTATLYAGDSRPQTKVIGESLRTECSLRAAVAFANKNDMVLYARLGMNRHYGQALSGALRSKYIADHPEWMERQRNGQVDDSKVCYAVPEYRAERIAILLEAAQLGAHGLCLDFCRQPPIARYHSLILDPWLKDGKTDPRNHSTASPEFGKWAQYRSSFVTLFMRDLRVQLRKLEQTTQRKIPVLVRIPEATLPLNVMEGLDVETWAKEGLIDEIALNPLWIWDFNYPDTAQPYVQLARAHGMKIYGGANTVTGKGSKANARSFLERVARNYDEGVDGISLFQTDASVLSPGLKKILGPLFPALANAGAVADRLTTARKAQVSLTESERFFGLDNHSLLPELGRNPRISLETI